MGPRQITAIILLWLGFTGLAALGLSVAILERRQIGWLGVTGASIAAVCVFLWAPAFPAFKSSGKWYSLSKLQPTLKSGPSSMSWKSTARYALPGAMLVAPGLLTITALGFSGVLERLTPRTVDAVLRCRNADRSNCTVNPGRIPENRSQN